jgi:LacI family transcriptional regulator
VLKKSITVYDIAKEAGVSPATVSRVLTGNANVSYKKKEIIQSIINKYNYKPNAIARSLINEESMMIGLILPDITNPFFASLFVEMERHAVSLGYSILLCNAMNDNHANITNLESFYLKMLAEKHVDGIIMMGGRVNESKTNQEHAEEVIEVMEQIPVVMINGSMVGVDCYRVISDEKFGLNQVIDYLYSLGHRKMGFIGGMKGITSTDIKIRTFLSEAKKHGIVCRKDWIINGTYSVESGYETMNQLLNNRELPTAVLAVNDTVAAGALKAAQKRGISVPEDISITGFDNTYITDIVTPTLTTVSHNYSDLAKTAVDIIVKASGKKNIKKEFHIKSKLVIKESCAPAKQK